MSNAKPITPDEVAQARIWPEGVIETWNQVIATKWNGRVATVTQDEIVTALVALGFERSEVFEQHLLDVEPLYRDAGWSVVYDKPGLGEGYRAFFVFERAKGGS